MKEDMNNTAQQFHRPSDLSLQMKSEAANDTIDSQVNWPGDDNSQVGGIDDQMKLQVKQKLSLRS